MEGETGNRDPVRSRGRGGAPWPSTYALVCLKELEQTPLPKNDLLLPLIEPTSNRNHKE